MLVCWVFLPGWCLIGLCRITICTADCIPPKSTTFQVLFVDSLSHILSTVWLVSRTVYVCYFGRHQVWIYMFRPLRLHAFIVVDLHCTRDAWATLVYSIRQSRSRLLRLFTVLSGIDMKQLGAESTCATQLDAHSNENAALVTW